jgi:hypothetical protein
MDTEDLNHILYLHDEDKISDKEALKRIKALNKHLLEHSLDPDILAGVPTEHDHLKRNKLTHWRSG